MAEPPPPSAAQPATYTAALTALGIVYGDLGTSPLYTLQAVVEAAGGRFTPASALGVLSLIVWTLIMTVSIKYCFLVMRADNHGEGGILALMSLVGANRVVKHIGFLTAAGLLGAALIYGDGVITPAISVLSSLEGVTVVTRQLGPYIMPLGVVILVALFAVQRLGTASIGVAFGPVMLVWFAVIGVLGLGGVIHHPSVLMALDPRQAGGFLIHSGAAGPLILGGVFLCATGGEALYADMGHIGKGPIRLAWYAIVLPALLLNYAGQTGVLLEGHGAHANPFFLLVPRWAIYPMVALATVATVIASQAIITGSFSMTRQAMQLGWLPGMNIRQTSDNIYGQIYVPVVNGLMMIATIGITIGFGSSARLGGAYGTAVSMTMMLTTVLLYTAMLRVWRWPLALAIPVAGVFLVIDVGYFGANLLKIADGGWLPLTIGAAIFFIMTTWRRGAETVRLSQARHSKSVDAFLDELERDEVPRPPGAAIFLTREPDKIPALMVDYVNAIGSLHQSVIIVSVDFEETPRVAANARSRVEHLGGDIWRVGLHFGFVEIPNLPAALARIKGLDCKADVRHAIYFGARDVVVRGSKSPMAGWRLAIFAWLYRNAVRMVDRFDLPPKNVIEIARQIEV